MSGSMATWLFLTFSRGFQSVPLGQRKLHILKTLSPQQIKLF